MALHIYVCALFYTILWCIALTNSLQHSMEAVASNNAYNGETQQRGGNSGGLSGGGSGRIDNNAHDPETPAAIRFLLQGREIRQLIDAKRVAMQRLQSGICVHEMI